MIPLKRVLWHLFLWHLLVQIPHQPGFQAKVLMKQAIRNLTHGQLELLSDYRVLVRWFQDQQRGYSGLQKNGATIANVLIFSNDLVTEDSDVFLNYDNSNYPVSLDLLGLQPARISLFFVAPKPGFLKQFSLFLHQCLLILGDPRPVLAPDLSS